jgi:hypothetical protein
MVEELCQGRIDVGHLTVVRMAFILSFEGFGRIIALMGVEAVDPEEPGLTLDLEPEQGLLDNNLCPPFDIREFLVVLGPVVIVVDIKSLSQSESGVQRERPDKCPCCITMSFEKFGQAQELVCDDEVGIIMNPMIQGSGSQ